MTKEFISTLLSHLHFTDDLVLFVESSDEHQKMLVEFYDASTDVDVQDESHVQYLWNLNSNYYN